MVKRPKTATAQLKVRILEPLRARLEKSAKQRRISLNSEIHNRLDQSFEWERSFGDAKKLMADTEASLAAGLASHLRQKGFQPILLDQGTVWAEPGMNISRMSVSVDASAVVREMAPEMAGILARALAKLAKQEDPA